MPVALPTLGCALTILLGALGLIAPQWVARLVGLGTLGHPGIAEVRATYGGLFLGLGLAALLLAEPAGYSIAGAAWGGAALVRVLSLVARRVDLPRQLGGIALEAGISILLLLGA